MVNEIRDYGVSLLFIRYAKWDKYKAFAIALLQFAVDIGNNDRERSLLSYRYETVDGNRGRHTVNILFFEFVF